MSQFNKNVLSLPYMNQFCGFIGTLNVVNNDYAYYLYHNRNISSMVYSQIFFQMITVINNVKTIPFFINDTAIDNVIDSFAREIFKSNFTNYTNDYVRKYKF